jgi:cell fate regulator YaaT (PSP1 superfamily)
MKAAVVVEADRGEDLGYVHATGELAEKRAAGVPHRPTEESPVTQSVKRLATPDELKRIGELREQDEQARRKAMELVKANNLVMKLTDAEWRWDRRKLTIYFTADKRVDFRNLVRELASMFRTRIELKQIGVRDEAKRLGGIGRCAREYCSASWLPELRPVNLGVAKDQRLSLNPTQISGACGRLMCCLRYEHDFYVQQRKRFPKEQKIIETSKGEERVISNDIFRERVTLRGVDGEVRTIALAELRREWRNPALPGQLLDEDTTPVPYEAISDEVLRMQDTSEMPAWRPDLRRDGLPARGALPVLPPPMRPRPPREAGAQEAADAAALGRAAASPGPGDRERGGRGDRRERPDRRSGDARPGRRRDDAGMVERRGEGDASAAADTTDPEQDAAAAEEGGDATSAEEQERRNRRRRGRRGGRRGRGNERGDTAGGSNDSGPGEGA